MFETPRKFSQLATALAVCSVLATAAQAIPDQFTYQAQLTSSVNGQPIVSSDVTVTFEFFYTPVTATIVNTQTFTNLDLSMTNGYVSIDVAKANLDFTQSIYMEVIVDDVNDASPPERLVGRQAIKTIPYAFNANSVGGSPLSGIQDYAQLEASAAQNNAIVTSNSYTDTQIAMVGGGGPSLIEFQNYRMVIVNAATTQTATPTGGWNDPFDNITDAYAFAKTITNAGDTNERIAVLLTPGLYDVPATLVLDTAGIDIRGLGESSSITGAAAPLLQTTADDIAISDIRLQPNDAANRAIEIHSAIRMNDVRIFRDFATPGGALVEVDVAGQLAPLASNITLKGVEIEGDVTITDFGDSYIHDGGRITGILTSTADSAPDGNETVRLSNLSLLASVSFSPSTGASLRLNRIDRINSFGNNGNLLLTAFDTNFGNPEAGTPLFLGTAPSSGSQLFKCFADPTGWGAAGFPAPSTGNVANYFIVYLAQL